MNIKKTLKRIVSVGGQNNNLIVDKTTYNYQLSKAPVASKMKVITVKL